VPTPLPKRSAPAKLSRDGTGYTRRALISHAKDCIAEAHQLRDKGQHLIEKSQDLRQKSTVCPVCKDRTIVPIKRHALPGKKKQPRPGSVVGYRCSRGHVFFATKKRASRRNEKKD